MARQRCRKCKGTEFNYLRNKSLTVIECRNCLHKALVMPTSAVKPFED